MPRPSNGPASQPGHPPECAGTYCEGSPAAPALVKKTVTRTPISPIGPSARRSPDGRSAAAVESSRRACPRGGTAAWIGALDGAGAIGIASLLRLVAGRRAVGNVEFRPKRV
jgi:hypothetical protein